MKKTVVDPSYGQGLEELKGSGVTEPIFSAGVIIDSDDLRFVYLSGRVATDDAAPTVEGRQRMVAVGDVKEQTRQVIRNLQLTLGQVGGVLDDIVRVRVYVVAPMTREAFGQIHEARAEYFRKEHYPASTLIVVAGLVRADALIEIDADAVIQRPG
jgi:enamine deaminase RidA (YjgF/YER057c/UK114 family)